LQIQINGTARSCDVHQNTKALFVLRNDLGLVGVKMGCVEGHCGSCTVLVDGLPTTTCDLPLWALEGKSVRTPEGVGSPDHLHPVQQALLDEQPGQCGYCLSGIMMTAVALTERQPAPSEHEVRVALDKHLCRCGSHPRIVKAVMKAIQTGSAA
jgi:aerobic-type carbon monoxide dehydrogenase small subunit (CoxS/CutS family)